MTTMFPTSARTAAWRRSVLGGNPFRPDARGARASFFAPAARLCRCEVAAERSLSASLPSGLRKKAAFALRSWQVSQEIIAAALFRGRLPAGMDLPMTLNFAMALGNYSRALLFASGKAVPEAAALRLHAAFCAEMTGMPARMAVVLGRHGPSSGRRPIPSPAASALRLAAAINAALGGTRG